MPPRRKTTEVESPVAFVATGDISHATPKARAYYVAGDEIDLALFTDDELHALLRRGAIRPV